MRPALRRLAAASIVTLVACASPPTTPDAAPASDVGPDAPASFPACEVVAPSVAGTAETDAIADAPARCGAAPYRWLRAPELGQVVSRTRLATFRARALESLLGAAGVSVGRPLTHDVAVDTLVYLTQDRGRLVESSAALAYPIDVTEPTSLPTLLFAHGTSGFTAGCGPTRDTNWRLLTATLASVGHVAVAPDFLGLEGAGEPYGAPHPYLVGEATAMASLDAARAASRALASLEGPLCATPDLYVYGASQGGHAALFLNRYVPYYAREFRLRGTVAAIPATDFVAHVERALRSPVEATDFVVGFLASAAPWYGLGDRLSELFVPPLDTTIARALAAACDPALPPNDPLSAEFQPAPLAAAASGTFADLDAWGCMTREASLPGTSVPRLAGADPAYGILFVVAAEDTLLAPELERVGFDTLCAAGMPLTYLECEGASHADGALWSVPEVLAFFDARRAGEPFAPACTRPPASRCLGTPPAP